MSDWKLYQKKVSPIELRPYVLGESLAGISVNQEDEPSNGDMIARNPDNERDQWLVNKAYFEKHYEPHNAPSL